MAKDKFLIDLLKSANEKHVFFVVWALIAGGFAFLMYSFYRNSQKRNFKEGSENSTGKAVAPYKNNLPK